MILLQRVDAAISALRDSRSSEALGELEEVREKLAHMLTLYVEILSRHQRKLHFMQEEFKRLTDGQG